MEGHTVRHLRASLTAARVCGAAAQSPSNEYSLVAQAAEPFYVTDVGLAESRDQLLTQKHLIGGGGTGQDKLKVANNTGARLAMAEVAYKVMMGLGGLDDYAAALGAGYAQVDLDLALERDDVSDLALRPPVVLGDSDEAMAKKASMQDVNSETFSGAGNMRQLLF